MSFRKVKEKSSWDISVAVISTLAAHLCCVVPLVLLTMGAGGSWLSSFSVFEPFKPVFISLAMIFMASAFYSRYFKKPSVELCTAEVCKEPYSKKSNLYFWGANAVIVVSLAIPYLFTFIPAKELKISEPYTKRIVLKIKNMTCIACTAMVSNSLTPLEGVKKVRVTFQPPEAQVIYQPEKVSIERIIQSVTKIGHPASLKGNRL